MRTTPNTKQLTIAIPTYNRPTQMARLVELLLPKLDEHIQLLVLDNHSSTPADVALAPVITRYQRLNLRIIRHATNIGMSGNILRCFEAAEAKWIWIIGDDDRPTEEAVDIVVNAVNKYPKAVVVNFNSGVLKHFGVARTRTSIVHNIEQLATHLDNFGNFLFLSANVYRREAMLPWLRLGYFHIPTYGPHVSMTLAAIQAGSGSAVFHSDYIMHWEDASRDQHWNYENVANATPEMFSVVTNAESRWQLAKLSAICLPTSSLGASWKSIVVLYAVQKSDCNQALAPLLEKFLRCARINLLSGESIHRVSLAVISNCALLLCMPLLRPFCRIYLRLRGSGRREEPQAPTTPVDSMLSDDRV